MSTTTTEAVVNSLRVKDPEKSAEAMIPSNFLVEPAKDIKLTRICFENTDLADLSGCWAWVLDSVLSPEECALLVSVSRRRFDNAWDRVLSNEDEHWDQVEELTRMCDRAFWDLKPIWERIWKRIEDHVPEVKVLRDVPLVTGLGERKGDEGKMVWSLTGPNERARFIKYTGGEFINCLLQIFIDYCIVKGERLTDVF
ncbi:hypothetical protein V491_02828 [Pseudogymnoascus sp. VKM F-3775]|nr:hypothetical protein V491_02828 [Pseudogymnoascus sp. VKM F-3775]